MEFLRVLNRYLHQARELQILAGCASNTIGVADCNDAGTPLRVLGYRYAGCDPANLYLETTNATRKCSRPLTPASLTDLEESLQKGCSFSYAYPSTRAGDVQESDWLAWGRSRSRTTAAWWTCWSTISRSRVSTGRWPNDSETANSLARAPGLRQLLPLAPTLTSVAASFRSGAGRVLESSGGQPEPAWKDSGREPDQPGEFVIHLLEKDNGWLAAYYDTLWPPEPESAGDRS